MILSRPDRDTPVEVVSAGDVLCDVLHVPAARATVGVPSLR